MVLDLKLLDALERKLIKSINGLRAATEKRFNRYLKQAEKARDPKLRKRYFNTALNLVKRSEQLIDRMETEMAALKHPWRATTAFKTRAKKK